jgi:hypothetical protein
MRRAVLIATIATAAVFSGGGVCFAWDAVESWTGASTLILGKDTTHATHVSQEWTPQNDTMICDMGVTLRAQVSGGRSLPVEWAVRRYMGSDPTDGTIIKTGTIPAIRITTSATELRTGTGDCWVAVGGDKYSINFFSDQDNTNYLWYYFGANQKAYSQNWDYVPVSGWTSHADRELTMTLYGSSSTTDMPVDMPSCANFDPANRWLCEIATYIFVPSTASLNILATSREVLMDKAPFSWAATASSTLGGLNTGDTTTSTGILWTATSTGVNETITLFTPSDIAAKIPSDIQTLVKAISATAMWAMFFAWIVSLATSGHLSEHTGIAPPGEMAAIEGGIDDMLTEIDEIDALHGAAEDESYDNQHDL